MKKIISSFIDLDCWKKCRTTRLICNKLIAKLPKVEQYRLKDQIIRAARSTTNNIAEGYGRFHYQENIQFCRHSRGSLYELIDHWIIAFEEKYISEQELIDIKAIIEQALISVNGYINYLKSAKQRKS